MSRDPRYKWDARKAERNERKHRVSFELAKQVFGRTLLVVSHTSREEEDEETIRIISARKAEPQERRRYVGGS